MYIKKKFVIKKITTKKWLHIPISTIKYQGRLTVDNELYVFKIFLKSFENA